MIEISGSSKAYTSIIICALNHLHDLTIPCLNSVIQNTRENYELILIDDGSQDGTYEYFRSISRKAYRNESPRGVARCRNRGLRASEGNYICFLDNDVIVPPGWLSFLIQESRKDSRIGIIGPVLSNESGRWNQLPLSSDGLWDLAEISGAVTLIKREVLNRIGYLDERLTNCGEDTDYCFRAFLAGFRIVVTPRLTVLHKRFATRKDLSKTQMYKALNLLQQKWWQYRDILPVAGRTI